MTTAIVLLSLSLALLAFAVALSLPEGERAVAIRDKRVVKAEAEPLMLGAWIKGGGW